MAIDAARARAIADRRTGIGCDQLILLEPSDIADFRMRIWNADGGEVEACGNATRCVVAASRAATPAIETRGRRDRAARRPATAASVDMGEPRFGWEEIPLAYAMDTAAMPVAWDELDDPFAVNVGNPHVVFFVADARRRSTSPGSARVIERDPLFPERINVNVASRSKAMRSGCASGSAAPGLTLACGTGACATAVAAIRRKLVDSPVEVTPARRRADDRLGAGRDDPDDAAPPPRSSPASSTGR